MSNIYGGMQWEYGFLPPAMGRTIARIRLAVCELWQNSLLCGSIPPTAK